MTASSIQRRLKRRDARMRQLARAPINRVIARRMPMADALVHALADPHFEVSLMEFMHMATVTAAGGADLACLGCGQRWSLTCLPAAIVEITLLPGAERILAALCDDCANDDGKLETALARDLGTKTIEKITTEAGSA
jgi:hypothetical protein